MCNINKQAPLKNHKSLNNRAFAYYSTIKDVNF